MALFGSRTSNQQINASLQMLKKQTLLFLSELNKNNNRQWFEDNRFWYDETKADFEKLVSTLIQGISDFDNDIVGLEVKNCTFRQYRDVRFSKDKRPYKINMGAYFNKGGKKRNTAGYYFHLEPGKSMMAAGLWMPENNELAKVRQEIDYNFDEWRAILNNRSLKRFFSDGLSTSDSLKRPPKNYDETNPAIEYLKLKSFIISKKIDDTELHLPGLDKQLIQGYKTLQPFINFLNRELVEG